MKKIRVIVLMMLTAALLTGFSLNRGKVTLDSNAYIFYRNTAADTIIKDFEKNKNQARSDYAGRYFLARGVVISLDKKTLNIGAYGSKKTLKCVFEGNLPDIEEGDTVDVYGRLSVGLMGDARIEAEGCREAATSKLSEGAYTLNPDKAEPRTYYKGAMVKETLQGATFYVPREWEDCRENMLMNRGYRYVLNGTAGKMEMLYVFMIDKKAEQSLPNEDYRTQDFERSLFTDIAGRKKDDQVANFPRTTLESNYGARYSYYDYSYKEPVGETLEELTPTKHPMELVYQEVGKDKILNYLYVYDTSAHIEDVMAVMRMMEIK